MTRLDLPRKMHDVPPARRALLIAATFGVAAQLLFHREVAGLNVLVAVALFLALAWRLRTAPLRATDAWLPGFAIAFAAFAVVRTDAGLVAFDVAVAIGMSLATVAVLGGITISALPLWPLLRQAWSLTLATLTAAFPLIRTERPHAALAHAPLRSAAAYGLGAALAVPFLLLFGVLFVSADAVFARWARDTLEIGQWLERLGDLKDRSLIAVLTAWLAAGAFAWLAIRSPETPVPGTVRRRLPVEAATAFLLALDALFVAFVAFQITYLFGGRDTVEAAAIPYSEYARRGFFELLAVAIMVSGLLFALELALRRRTPVYVGAGLTLLGLTGVVLASSLYRLDLYQRAFGWSELRFYALAALAFVACALAILAAALVARRMHLALQPLVFTALGIALIVNTVGPSAFIARANIQRIAGPAAPAGDAEPSALHRELDRAYLISLGDGALPELVAGLERLPERERSCLEIELVWLMRGRADERTPWWQAWRDRGRDLEVTPSWQSWNLDRERARLSLLSIRDELLGPLVPPRDDYAVRPAARMEARYREDCERRGR